MISQSEESDFTHYVATLARYVLVDADSDAQARELGRVALRELHADVRERLGRNFPIDIRTVRPATDDEIELCRWQHEMVAGERKLGNG